MDKNSVDRTHTMIEKYKLDREYTFRVHMSSVHFMYSVQAMMSCVVTYRS